MGAVRCPKCRSESIRRSSRKGLIERLLSLAYVYPFRCQRCERRFRRLRWRERYIPLIVDRREYERIPTDFWSTMASGSEERQGRVVDLSVGGCQLETETPIGEGEVIQLKLDPSGQEPAIVVDQAVVRSVRPRRIGLQFIRVQQDHEGRLRQYLYQVSISRIR